VRKILTRLKTFQSLCSVGVSRPEFGPAAVGAAYNLLRIAKLLQPASGTWSSPGGTREERSNPRFSRSQAVDST